MYSINTPLYLALSALAETVTPHADHWIGNHPDGEQSVEFCPTCVKQAVANLKEGNNTDGLTSLTDEEKSEVESSPPHIDGGWRSEYDTIPRCDTCSVLLTGSLTSTAVDEEISHYESIEGDIEISRNEQAYELLELFDAIVTDDATRTLRAKAIESRIVVKTEHVTQDESLEGTLACGCGITRCECE